MIAGASLTFTLILIICFLRFPTSQEEAGAPLLSACTPLTLTPYPHHSHLTFLTNFTGGGRQYLCLLTLTSLPALITLNSLLPLTPQVEAGTPFGRWYQPGVSPLPSDDQSADMFELASEVLGAAGYQHYEVNTPTKVQHA